MAEAVATASEREEARILALSRLESTAQFDAAEAEAAEEQARALGVGRAREEAENRAREGALRRDAAQQLNQVCGLDPGQLQFIFYFNV